MIYTESDISKELDVLAPILANRSIGEIVNWLDILLERMNEHRIGAYDSTNNGNGYEIDYLENITIEHYRNITKVDLL